MYYFLAALAAIVVLLIGLNAFANANPVKMAKTLRVVIGVVGIALGLLLVVVGRPLFGLPIALAAVALLWRLSRRPSAVPSAGAASISEVRSTYVEMKLDHDTGVMSGRVLAGALSGRDLASLGKVEWRSLLLEVEAYDAQGQQLLEAYLDRLNRNWREEFATGGGADKDDTANAGRQSSVRPSGGRLTVAEAYEVLGLAEGATDDAIRAAHRDLMKRFHPDQGGSTYLAARINEAKDVLIARKRA